MAEADDTVIRERADDRQGTSDQVYALFRHATRPDKPGAVWTLISVHRTKEGAAAASKPIEAERGGWLIDGPIDLKE